MKLMNKKGYNHFLNSGTSSPTYNRAATNASKTQTTNASKLATASTRPQQVDPSQIKKVKP